MPSPVAKPHKFVMDSRRAESFSDGVFAVAITVLVFNLLPLAQVHTQDLASTLLSSTAWPTYLAYVVSFMTIGIMWLNHHTLLNQITMVDRTVLVLNLFLLMGIVAIPFPTALVASHLTGSGGNAAAVTYGLVMIAIGVGFGSTWLYVAAHQQALGAPGLIVRPRFSTFRFTIGNVGYVAGTLIALVNAVAALIIYGLLAVYYMFEHLPATYAGNDEGGAPADPESDG
jgi:uncharacterized membrane protein